MSFGLNYFGFGFIPASEQVNEPIYLTQQEASLNVQNNTLIPNQTYIISGVDDNIFGGTNIKLIATSTNSFAQQT